MSRLTAGYLPESLLPEMQALDDRVDEALMLLDLEEPTLSEYLTENREATRLLEAHSAAAFALLTRDQKTGTNFGQTMRRLERLTSRTVAALALGAVLNERRRALK